MKLTSLFKKKDKEETKNQVEDFAYLLRIYFQSILAERLGISNLAILPDLRLFKQTLHIATENNRIGKAEGRKCKKILMQEYGLPDSFFKTIDLSVKRNARNSSQMQEYLFRFQNFTQNMLTIITTKLNWKLRIPSTFKNTLHTVIQQGVHDLYTKEKIKDQSLLHSIIELRHQAEKLCFDEEWSTNYIFNVVYLAKKSPKPKEDNE